MVLKDLLDLASNEKRKRMRLKVVQKFAVGMGGAAAAGVVIGILFAPKSGKETREDLKKRAVNTVETIKDTVQQKVDTVKDSAAHVAQEVCHVIKDIHGKAEDVKKEIKDGCDEIKQDIHKTKENILKRTL